MILILAKESRKDVPEISIDPDYSHENGDIFIN